MRIRIPTMITFARLALIPIFIVVFYLPFRWSNFTAAAVFGLASISDWLDGYLARKLNQTSKFGEFLDPVADKLMVVIALVLIAANPRFPFVAIPVAIIVGREITVSALREWMAELGKRASVGVSFVGKFKTAIQFIAIVTLLASNPVMPTFFLIAGYILFYVAAGLTLWSMIMYLKAAWPDFKIE